MFKKRKQKNQSEQQKPVEKAPERQAPKAEPKKAPKFCDGLTVGQYLNIDGQKLRVIGIDTDTVTMNASGHPVVWQRQWLNDYPQSQICKI